MTKRERIIEVIKDKGAVTSKDIRGYTGYSAAAIKKQLNLLDKEGKIKKISPHTYTLNN